jgi:hypothetical protein
MSRNYPTPANGTPAVWHKYLDPDMIYAEEDDSYKGKCGMIKEVHPLPQGLGGEIKVELLSYRENGNTRIQSPGKDQRFCGSSSASA